MYRFCRDICLAFVFPLDSFRSGTTHNSRMYIYETVFKFYILDVDIKNVRVIFRDSQREIFQTTQGEFRCLGREKNVFSTKVCQSSSARRKSEAAYVQESLALRPRIFPCGETQVRVFPLPHFPSHFTAAFYDMIKYLHATVRRPSPK